MRHFLRRWTPPFTRALLIESGSRGLLENFIPWIYANFGPDAQVDVLTCFGDAPRALNPATSTVFQLADYQTPDGRGRLLADLLARNYTVLVIICSAEPIMFKWKWWLAGKLPLKTLILNENGDFFWIDRTQWRLLLHFVLYRAGLTGEGAAPRIAQLLLFPLTLAYLLLFAGWVHLKRALRTTLARS